MLINNYYYFYYEMKSIIENKDDQNYKLRGMIKRSELALNKNKYKKIEKDRYHNEERLRKIGKKRDGEKVNIKGVFV